MILTCRKVAELLIEYVDGSMPDEDRAIVQRHLCGCVPCAIYLHTYSETIRLTRALPDVPVPTELSERLLRLLEKHSSSE